MLRTAPQLSPRRLIYLIAFSKIGKRRRGRERGNDGDTRPGAGGGGAGDSGLESNTRES